MATLETIAIKDVITFAIAVYGAALSTFNLVQSITKERRQVIINQTAAFYALPAGGVGPAMVNIDVINRGHRPVVVSAPTMQMPNGRLLVFINADGFRDFPKRLEDGETGSIRMPYHLIASSLRDAGYSGKVDLRAICIDTTGKRYWGKKYKFDIDADWTNV
jgi:hypothetical protein